jgi:hypothetical protein
MPVTVVGDACEGGEAVRWLNNGRDSTELVVFHLLNRNRRYLIGWLLAQVTQDPL